MNDFKILCEIGDQISFNIAGVPTPATIDDLADESYLNRIYRIQFSRAPQSKFLERAINIIKCRPDIPLRFYGDYAESTINWDLLFEVQHLRIDLLHIESLKEISRLENLKSLAVSKNVTSKVSLSILEPLQNLEILHTSISKDVSAIGTLKNLRTLTLYKVINDNIDFLTQTNSLNTLSISLGSFKSLNAIKNIANLDKLYLHQVRGFNDETAEHVLSKCKMLTTLKLDNLKHLTRLNFIKEMVKLKYLSLEAVKNIVSFNPISESKSLETITGYQCQPLDKSLSGLRYLKNVGFGDSYSKSEIINLCSSQSVENVIIKGKKIKGTVDHINNPFLNWA